MTVMEMAGRGGAEGPLGETPGFEEWAEEIMSILRARREEGATAVSGVGYSGAVEPPELPDQASEQR